MLRCLTVQNFAIISDLTLHFAQGLNVFSGETGAGKSIVIEALGFVLGARGDVSAIKDGADKMLVCAEFSSQDLPQNLRQEYQIAGDVFVLRRELDRKGKGKAWVEGRTVTVSALSQLGRHLVDFHGQHDHQSLLHSSVHLMLLDKFAKQEKLLCEVRQAYQQVQALQAQLDALRLSAQEKERLLDMSQYQLKEIEDVNPSAEEDAQLEQTLPKMKHAGRLLEMAQEAYYELYAAEDAASARAGKAARTLESMAELDESLAPLAQDVNSALVTLEEAANTLGSYKDDINLEPDALDKMLSRHEKLKRLKAKYGPEISDVLKTAEELRQKIDQLQHGEEHEQELQAELEKRQKVLLKLARELHEKRMAAGEKLAALITQEIRPLGFNAVRFSVAVEMDEENVGPTGADKVEFLFSPNPGQALRPLKNIASGGEISRVMLGLKTVLAPTVPVMVFDEVDAGIGGETGWLVGQKLHQAAQGRQVLCVTHLAQVAAQANQNFHVSKTATQTATRVAISPLAQEGLIAEIARMLGGGADKHSAAFSHARELLKNAKRLA
ncbi:MAG: DNA repair protein RecN [Elusimicrobia bacterium]|nr:DNA repair protein RecN [Elusimicrobiota bacterium]MDY5729346.1 DNA repair protein RecN [Elusimicrobiaceae bacterium]